MAHRRCVMAKQSERYLPFVGYIRSFSEIREPVLQVLPFRSRHKLQLGPSTNRPGGHNQAAVCTSSSKTPPSSDNRLVSVSSPTRSRRSVEAESQPALDANLRRKSLNFGRASASNTTLRRLRRGPASSMNTIMMTATRAPEVIPLPSSTLKNPSHSRSGKIHWFWNPTPIQNASPATAAFRWSTPSWMMIFIPCTKSRPSRKVI